MPIGSTEVQAIADNSAALQNDVLEQYVGGLKGADVESIRSAQARSAGTAKVSPESSEPSYETVAADYERAPLARVDPARGRP